MKHIAFCLAVICLACNNNGLKSTQADSTINTSDSGFNVHQMAGVFYDTLSCAGCPGIATKLYLKPDTTFVMEEKYIGKNITYTIGKWAETDSILNLTGSDNKQRRFKIIDHAELQLLNGDSAATAGTATHISLRRNNVPFVPLQPVPLTGMFSAREDTMHIYVCAMHKNFAVALAPAAIGIKTAYAKAVKQPDSPVFASIAGHFELRPSLKDTTTQDFFVIEKFVKLVPGEACK